MDSLRGNLGGYDTLEDTLEDEGTDHAPPPEIGTDERRMQVRAYNYWASLLQDRSFPNVDDIDFDLLPDFGPHGVLLDFSSGGKNPAITFLGDKLARECGVNEEVIERLEDVPSRSLLSRITDHYMQILANQAPIGFEAEFVNAQGQTILYRGILLPLSGDDESIDFIFGVINWKELADASEAEELLLEIDQALQNSETYDLSAEEEIGEDEDRDGDGDGDEYYEEDEVEDDSRYASLFPRMPAASPPMDNWADGPGADVLANDASAAQPAASSPADDDLPRPSFTLDDPEEEQATASEPPLVGSPEQEEATLTSCLQSARQLAAMARHSEERTRNALYDAISRAYDFSLAADESPEEFAAMVENAGLETQERAPLTPLVKLVFGKHYDKTRLTEYATAIAHARRKGLERDRFGDFLRDTNGGLKAIVAEERRLRRLESGKPTASEKHGPRPAIAKKLRALDAQSLNAVATHGEEFALVIVRRTEEGEVVVLGEVPEDAALVEKAARMLLG
ncbi:PAS domain-containing protein [Alteraurantiacibacter aquimixticola]|uniref:PAS domain-containing protein n=1 Tax=Alteraurantiacibacter aquimixticola TaxID=2489173 RepID=A0A4T3EX48_9SPHN|nr:hypothetical protein [Alteraurantiacibacter aquimixticola]TIX49083.1 hypothetical protein E5222_15265 [Alteraurantiacibacter aquimixticola]